MRLYSKLSQYRYGFLPMIFLLILPAGLKAQHADTSGHSKPISLRSTTSVFLAGQQEYSFDEIANNRDIKFIPLSDIKENTGFSKDHYWMRLSLENPTEKHVEFYLETARPITDVVHFYLMDQSGAIQQQISGDKIPFAEKSVQHRKSMFEVELDPFEKVDAFIHLKSDGEVLMLPLRLYQKDQFFNLTYKEQVFYGFFYGILVLACIIYLFFYLALKDRAFIYYGLYVLFIALMQFSLDGFFHQYITPSGGWLSEKAVLLTAFTSLFFFGKYGDKFLNLKENSPLLHKCSKILGIGVIIGILIVVFMPHLLAYSYPIANFIGILVLIHMITCLVVFSQKKIHIDPYFIIGISFLVFGFVVFILNNFNVIDNSFFTNNGAKFGIGLEIIFLSISMSNRIRNLRLENETNQLLALQRAKDMNEIKSSFISNISHELRTPLNLIMGVASSLQQNKVQDDLEEKCKLILQSSHNLLGCIEDILDFTVIEKGNQELNEVSFDLPATLNRVMMAQEKKAKVKGLVFSFSIPRNLPVRIVGDKGKLVQILNHLLDNAIKFTNQGGVSFEVVCKPGENNRVLLDFTINDTGIGISKEKMCTVYESFTKKSFIDKREFSGLGLGLFIVKSYVDLQGGSIDIANNPVKGTICKLGLGYEADDRVTATNQLQNDFTESKKEVSEILLVEDNKMNQTVVKLLFKKYRNVNLSIANHGKEAVELLGKNHYDLILMDLQMPEMDGFEATSLIRSGRAGCSAQIPIIILTADNTGKTRKEIFRLGANELVTKPVEGSILFSRINKLLLPKTKVS